MGKLLKSEAMRFQNNEFSMMRFNDALKYSQCFQMYVFSMNTMSVSDRFTSMGENASKTRYAFSTENRGLKLDQCRWSTVYRQKNSKMLLKCKDLRTPPTITPDYCKKKT